MLHLHFYADCSPTPEESNPGMYIFPPPFIMFVLEKLLWGVGNVSFNLILTFFADCKFSITLTKVFGDFKHCFENKKEYGLFIAF